MSGLLGVVGLVMKKASAAFGCAYPLDADQDEIDSLFGGGRDRMSTADNEQTGTWLMTAADVDFQQSVLIRSFIPEDRPDLVISDGKRIVEMEFLPPTLGAEDTVVLSQFCALYGLPASVGVRRYRGSDGLYELTVNGSTADELASAPTLFAFGFDFTDPEQAIGTCHLTVWADGEVFATYPAYSVSAAYTPQMLCTQSGAPDVSAVGQPASISLRTFAADMTGTYPSGWTDVCGNPL